MAGSLNMVQLIGNVGKDPEIRSLGSGDRVANLSIATSERWRDKQSGEQKEKTEWHRVVIFDENLVKVVENYVKKGSKLYVQGKLQTRKWTDNAGAEKFSTEVVLQKFGSTLTMLDSKRSGDDEGGGYASGGGGGYSQASGGGYRDSGQGGGFGGPREQFPAELDDEIPF